MIAIIAGDAHPRLAQDIAGRAGLPLITAAVGAFADGERNVRIEEDVRGRAVCIVQPTATPVDERLMTLALLADAACAAGASRVIAAIPYFGYARQDVRQQPGEPRSAQLAARLLAAAGVHEVIALELHSPALESAFPMPLTQLTADELILPHLRREHVVVSPDAGGLKRAQRYARALGAPLAAVAKARTGVDMAVPLQVLGDVRGRACFIVDDMASTGRTIAGAARALSEAGAAQVHAFFVHAVMARGALERIREAGVRRIVTTDSVGPIEARELEVLPTATLFSKELLRRKPP